MNEALPIFLSFALMFSLPSGGVTEHLAGDTYVVSLSPNGSISSLKDKKTQRGMPSGRWTSQ